MHGVAQRMIPTIRGKWSATIFIRTISVE